MSHKSGPLHGEVTVPGDKSVSHRALMLAGENRQAGTSCPYMRTCRPTCASSSSECIAATMSSRPGASPARTSVSGPSSLYVRGQGSATHHPVVGRWRYDDAKLSPFCQVVAPGSSISVSSRSSVCRSDVSRNAARTDGVSRLRSPSISELTLIRFPLLGSLVAAPLASRVFASVSLGRRVPREIPR